MEQVRRMNKSRLQNLPKKVDQCGLLQQLNWFQVNSDIQESRTFLYEYLTDNGKSSIADILKKTDFEFHPSDGFVARLLSLGTEIPDNSLESFNNRLKNYVASANVVPEEKPKEPISAHIRYKPLNYVNLELGEIEVEIDKFIDNDCRSDFSMLVWLHENSITKKTANGYIALYEPLAKELEKAVDGDKYYADSYTYMSRYQLKRFLKFVNGIIDDVRSYTTVTRKARKKKIKTPEQLVAKLPYNSEGSISPTKIIGASRLWIYDVSTRDLTLYQALDTNGLTVSGRTISNFDTETSARRKLTKSKNNDPADLLQRIKISTKQGAMNTFEGLITKKSAVHGRMNKNTILLKVSMEGDE